MGDTPKREKGASQMDSSSPPTRGDAFGKPEILDRASWNGGWKSTASFDRYNGNAEGSVGKRPQTGWTHWKWKVDIAKVTDELAIFLAA